MKILDFSKCGFGLIVTRSQHWNETRFIKPNQRKELGIIVSKKFYQDAEGKVICWPDVFWEGGVMSSITHPALVAPYRKGVKLPTVEMTE